MHKKWRGRPQVHGGPEQPQKVMREASDQLCSKRLQSLLPEMIKALAEHGERQIDGATEARLCWLSIHHRSTAAALPKAVSEKRISTTEAGRLLKSSILNFCEPPPHMRRHIARGKDAVG